MKTILLTFLIFSLSIVSCRKNEEANAALYQTWEVKEFMSLESVAYPKNESNRILLTLSKSGSYSLKLDINSCGGQFNTSGKNGISIESGACTEACCDSPFSQKLTSMLPKVKSYQIDKNTLRLEVPQWGFIELER